MQKFAFISQNSIRQCYDFVLNKQRSHKYFMDVLKIGGLLMRIIVSGFFYLRFVSLASTKGYFLRQANNQFNATSFQYEIVKTKILDQKQKNWEEMYSNNQNKSIVDIRPEVVKIPTKAEFAYNK